MQPAAASVAAFLIGSALHSTACPIITRKLFVTACQNWYTVSAVARSRARTLCLVSVSCRIPPRISQLTLQLVNYNGIYFDITQANIADVAPQLRQTSCDDDNACKLGDVHVANERWFVIVAKCFDSQRKTFRLNYRFLISSSVSPIILTLYNQSLHNIWF